MTTLAAPLTAPAQLALALVLPDGSQVVCDEPTAKERADLMRQLRRVYVGDAWVSGEYRVERYEADSEYVRLVRGSHVCERYEVTSAAKLASALRSFADVLLGAGITDGWLREGAMCGDCGDDEGSPELLYDAFEAFIQEGLWRTQAGTCTSSVGTSLSVGTTRRYQAANTSSVILTGWRRSWTLPATSSSGAKSGASNPTRSIRSTSGVMSAGIRARKPTSRPTRRGSTGFTPSARNAATAIDAKTMRRRRRGKARRSGTITGTAPKNRK